MVLLIIILLIVALIYCACWINDLQAEVRWKEAALNLAELKYNRLRNAANRG